MGDFDVVGVVLCVDCEVEIWGIGDVVLKDEVVVVVEWWILIVVVGVLIDDY